MGKSCVCHTIPRVTCSTVRTEKRVESENKQKKKQEKNIVPITIASDDTHSVYSRHLTFGRLFTKRKKKRHFRKLTLR